MDETTSISPYPTLGEDEISNANTEDSLLGSRKSSETISTVIQRDTECCILDKKNRKCGPSCTLVTGIILVSFGISSLICTPFQILMNERLRMTPLFPPYQWWKNPPDEVLLRVYIFNITNHEKFLNGSDAKLNLQEIGPIIFREKLEHFNVTFNDNGTLSYTAKRTAIFLPEMNTIDLNSTLILPNLAVLGMASYLWDASFFTKFGFGLLLRRLKSEPIVQITVNDYLWNFSDPILDVAQSLMPILVPVKNLGILSRIYSDFENEVTVYIGLENGHEKYFLIDRYDGTEFLPGFGASCQDRVLNSTEGVAYAQFLTKKSILRYWRKTICKVTPLIYESDVIKYSIDAYKFILPNETFNRTDNDCYVSRPPLADGLSDVSKCYHNFPMAASFPHFLYGDEVLKTYVDGLLPSCEKHGSFVVVEPLTGIPMESRARSQSNLVIRKLTGLNEKFLKFSDIILPMFWAEYNQVGLPWYIQALIYATVNIVLPLQFYFSLFLIITGLVVAYISSTKFKKIGKRLALNKALHFVPQLDFRKK